MNDAAHGVIPAGAERRAGIQGHVIRWPDPQAPTARRAVLDPGSRLRLARGDALVSTGVGESIGWLVGISLFDARVAHPPNCGDGPHYGPQIGRVDESDVRMAPVSYKPDIRIFLYRARDVGQH